MAPKKLILREWEAEALINRKMLPIVRAMEPQPWFGPSFMGWDFHYTNPDNPGVTACWSPGTLPTSPLDKCAFCKIGDHLIANTDTGQCEMLVGVSFLHVVHSGKPIAEIKTLPEHLLLNELRAWKWYWRMTLFLLEARGKLKQRSLILYEGAKL